MPDGTTLIGQTDATWGDPTGTGLLKLSSDSQKSLVRFAAASLPESLRRCRRVEVDGLQRLTSSPRESRPWA